MSPASLALCVGFLEDLEAAQQCADGAAALLKPAHQDYVWRELQDLKRKPRGAGSINATLREWSQGIVGNKSFQQVSGEFAAIVIPKVWRREGHKIARVVARLSISPKKVRRILRDQGLLKGTEGRSLLSVANWWQHSLRDSLLSRSEVNLYVRHSCRP
jgi:hypothetical protein